MACQMNLAIDTPSESDVQLLRQVGHFHKLLLLQSEPVGGMFAWKTGQFHCILDFKYLVSDSARSAPNLDCWIVKVTGDNWSLRNGTCDKMLLQTEARGGGVCVQTILL